MTRLILRHAHVALRILERAFDPVLEDITGEKLGENPWHLMDELRLGANAPTL